MDLKREFSLVPAVLFVALSLTACDLSGALVGAGNPSKLNFASSHSDTHQADTALPDAAHPSDTPLMPCGSSLAPGESCTLAVQFSPIAAGSRSGTMQIRSNGEVLEEIALAGQGE